MKAQKIIFAVCALAAAAALLATARAAAGGGGGGGLEVTGLHWKYEGYAPVERVDSRRSVTSTRVARGTSYVFKYRARVTVRNTGERTVRSVSWDYVFAAPEGGRELKRYRAQSRVRIAPGESQTLTKDVLIDPAESTRHLNTGVQQALVTRVEYTDGPAWRAPDGPAPAAVTPRRFSFGR